MTSRDYEYYSKRAEQERERAERSGDHSARYIHLEMAERYAAMLEAMPVIQQQAQA